MDLIAPKDLLQAFPPLKVFGGEPLARIIYRAMKLDEVNRNYLEHEHEDPDTFIDSAYRVMQISHEVWNEDLEKIPKEGPFITVSNHPYGGPEGIILLNVLPKVRPDYRILVNFLLTKMKPIQGYFMGVNPFETHRDVKSSFGGLKDAFLHIQQGHPLGIFPAGEVSTYHFKNRAISDKEWQHSILKLIKKAHVPVVPIYFEGHNGNFFHFLGMIHPLLRTARLPSELFNKKGKVFRIRIGSPVPVKEQDEYRDITEYGRFLRLKTYALGLSYKKPRKHFTISFSHPAPVIPPVDQNMILEEIEKIRKDYLLLCVKENSVFCVPTEKIPVIMSEIGRLREITYRDVGEGTRKALDIDPYDPYFEQLFVWDDEEKKLVGGYRIGKGETILKRSGMKGFYITSLFNISKKFAPVLQVSMELGRSFVVKDYQRRALSLFLLWKGILYILLKHPAYRYLIGPVSISNEFREVSKSLTVACLRHHHMNTEFAEFIRPKREFKEKIDRIIDLPLFLRHVDSDISRLDKFIQDIDPAFKTPILLKKYLSVNSEILGFNVDPLFNYCLDALTILDLFELPRDTIETLSKEFNDQSILERFKK